MTSKFRAVTLALVGLAGLASAQPARAQSSGGGAPSEYISFLKMKAMEVMHMMDQGGKGHVTKDEYLEFQRAFFDRMDKNKDGKVTVEEWLGRPARPDEK